MVFPEFSCTREDPFIQNVARSHKKWVIIADAQGQPRYVLDADKFLREALLESEFFSPWSCCHVPVIVKDHELSLGEVILQLKSRSTGADDEIIDRDVVLVWGTEKKIITGADILGRLLMGVAGTEVLLENTSV
jgi:hypothetical protein